MHTLQDQVPCEVGCTVHDVLRLLALYHDHRPVINQSATSTLLATTSVGSSFWSSLSGK